MVLPNLKKLYNFFRQEIVTRLQNQHTLVSLVTDNLSKYMDEVRKFVQGKYIFLNVH
jgi:hypothetical protein